MSEDTYHALIVKHYQRSISAHADTIGGKANSPRYTTSAFYQMARLTIPLFVRYPGISKVSGISTSGNISPEVV